MDYDTWKETKGNPHQADTGPCGICEGEGNLSEDGLECPHCKGSSECGCLECEAEIKANGRDAAAGER